MSKSKKVLFQCGECGGDVVATTGPGRVSEYKVGVWLPVPSEVPVRRCTECGEDYLTAAESTRLSKAQAKEYAPWRAARARSLLLALQQHGYSLRELELACGVTGTYFSHVARGRKVASLSLVRHLEALLAAPSEIARHVRGAGVRFELSAQALRTVGEMLTAEFGAPTATYEQGDVQLGAAANDVEAAA